MINKINFPTNLIKETIIKKTNLNHISIWKYYNNSMKTKSELIFTTYDIPKERRPINCLPDVIKFKVKVDPKLNPIMLKYGINKKLYNPIIINNKRNLRKQKNNEKYRTFFTYLFNSMFNVHSLLYPWFIHKLRI